MFCDWWLWTSQDPLGFDAGDSNAYRYVTNRPTRVNDPSGLVGQVEDVFILKEGDNVPAYAKNTRFPYAPDDDRAPVNQLKNIVWRKMAKNTHWIVWTGKDMDDLEFDRQVSRVAYVKNSPDPPDRQEIGGGYQSLYHKLVPREGVFKARRDAARKLWNEVRPGTPWDETYYLLLGQPLHDVVKTTIPYPAKDGPHEDDVYRENSKQFGVDFVVIADAPGIGPLNKNNFPAYYRGNFVITARSKSDGKVKGRIWYSVNIWVNKGNQITRNAITLVDKWIPK